MVAARRLLQLVLGSRGELLENFDALRDPGLQRRLHGAAAHLVEALQLHLELGGGLALHLIDVAALLLAAAGARRRAPAAAQAGG